MASVLADYRWGDFSRVIDFGGASGSMLAAIMRQHPHMSGVLFDLPQVDIGPCCLGFACLRCQWQFQCGH